MSIVNPHLHHNGTKPMKCVTSIRTLITEKASTTPYFSAAQLKAIYNVPTVPVNAGKKRSVVSIIIAFHHPKIQADLANFWKYNNFPGAVPIINIKNLGSNTNINSTWYSEACLDTQIVAAMNPNATINLIEAKSASLSNMIAAINTAKTLGSDVISMSWGANDNKVFSASQYGQSLFTNNICYCASTGDTEWPSWPSVATNCIAVGGTSLYSNPRLETTWEKAGCGYSLSNPKPPYQSNIVPPSGVPSARYIPDISLVANPATGVTISVSNKFVIFGGTSLSAPFFGSIISLANQQRFNLAIPKLGLTSVASSTQDIHNILYKTINNTTLFYDVMNGIDKQGSTVFEAKYGFDLCTGWGSVRDCTELCSYLSTVA